MTRRSASASKRDLDDAARPGRLDRVADDVEDHLPDLPDVGDDLGDDLGGRHCLVPQLDPGVPALRAKQLDRLAQQFGEIDLLRFQLEGPAQVEETRR